VEQNKSRNQVFLTKDGKFRDQFYDFISIAQYLYYIFLSRGDGILIILSYVIEINLI
jgi:hypothetical protein